MIRGCCLLARRRRACVKWLCLLLAFALVAFFLTAAGLFNSTPSDIHISLDTARRERSSSISPLPSPPESKLASATCILPDKRHIKCVKSSDALFVDFDFVRRKFNLNSERSSSAAGEFRILFNTHKIFRPASANRTDTDADAEYLWYGGVNVEARERVMHIDMEHGVPVSSQWLKSGHLYPTQIAQYGLSHWSKWARRQRGAAHRQREQLALLATTFVASEENAVVGGANASVYFSLSDSNKALYRPSVNGSAASLAHVRYFAARVQTTAHCELIFELMLHNYTNSSSSSSSSGTTQIQLVYAFDAQVATRQAKNAQHVSAERLPDGTYRVRYLYARATDGRVQLDIVRNLCLDALKPLGKHGILPAVEKCLTETTPNHEHDEFVKVYQMAVRGRGRIDNATLRVHAPHYALAKTSADYLLAAQEASTGGWPIRVTRTFAFSHLFALKSSDERGWYSAMSQGQAISLLCRVYAETGESAYWRAASDALAPFSVDVARGGVRAYFLNSSDLVWFEEYPTRPSHLFVLNGFLYSLLGLADFLHICSSSNGSNSQQQQQQEHVRQMLAASVSSLLRLVNLFDTGTRTLYDLRHLAASSVTPNVARWDYHALHVSQLTHLARELEREEQRRVAANNHFAGRNYSAQLRDVALRWTNYADGIVNKNTQIRT